MDKSIFKSKVSGFLSLIFVGTFALGAGLIIWHAAFGENPLANAMASQLSEYPQSY
jgi:hypothetical protein